MWYFPTKNYFIELRDIEYLQACGDLGKHVRRSANELEYMDLFISAEFEGGVETDICVGGGFDFFVICFDG